MPNAFLQYDISDFASDESFIQWVLDLASTHRPFWENYIADHPQQTDKILAARELVAQLHRVDVQPTDPELAQAIWKTIRERTQTDTTERPARRQSRRGTYPVWRVAAALLLTVGLGFAGWQWQLGRQPLAIPNSSVPDGAEPNVPDSLIEEVNRTSIVLHIHLGDGSVVSLEKDSRLSYPRHFTGPNRVTYLIGDAVFTVANKAEQPFLVHTRHLVIRTLGNRLSVSARENAANERVAVQAGRVSVVVKATFDEQQATDQVAGMVLNPNQQAVFWKATARLGKTLVDVPVVLNPVTDPTAFAFVNTRVQTIFDRLATAYAISIVYEPGLTTGPSITVNLTNRPFHDQLKIICKTANLTYQLIDGQVIVSQASTEFPRRQN